MTRIVWTNEEKQLVVSRMVEYERISPGLTNLELLRAGQSALPNHRRLVINHGRVHNHKKRIAQARAMAKAKAIPEPKVEEKAPERVEAPTATYVPTPPPERNEGPTTRLLDILELFLDVIATRVAMRVADAMQTGTPAATEREHAKHNPLPLNESKCTGLPGVLVIGLLPQQENTIRTVYGTRLDLCFMDVEEAKTLPVKRRAHTVLMTKFINHAVQEKYRQAPMLHFCNGGTTDLAKILDKVCHP